ncbi:MAG: ribosomal RNA small subunit methyltransferase A [Clostridia bacterium]|nr:ribosomal RNA small subunit methyltransferase A [Clostridia bacterium]
MKSSRDLIAEYSLTPNKALGQNFLTDASAIERIVSAAAEPGLSVLEIGPGLGALTFPLAEAVKKLVCVELDSALCGILERELPVNASVINADFLKTDIGKISEELGGGEIVAVGNLPYYITSDIAMKLASSPVGIRRMVLMMQREAAARFTAQPGDRNYVPLTVLSRLRFRVSVLAELSPASYFPQPEVSSTVLVFDALGSKLPADLPRFLKAAFSMRRKTLINNLAALGYGKEETAAKLKSLGFDPSVRAEALSPEELLSLAEAL